MNLVLLVGCARSGTSILGELIGAHPEVKYIFEAHSIWEIGGLGVNDSHRLTAENATSSVKQKIREWFESQSEGSLVFLEKNPRNILRIPYVHAIFPEARIVHIVRDGRDVACSMVPGCGREEWGQLKPPSWRGLFQQYTGVERCARAWKDILEIGLHDLSTVSHIHVRYEDLLAEPAAHAARILGYMGLQMHPQVEAFSQRIANETSAPYHAKIQDRWYEDDHRLRIGRWRENLNAEEQASITGLLSPLLQRLGYSVNHDQT